MAYATIIDYTKYASDDVPDEIERLLDDASDTVNRVTFNRVRSIGIDGLTEYQAEMVKKATCLQAKFIAEYGEYINMPLSGYSAGSISLNFSKDNMIGGEVLDTKAIQCLKNSGLAGRRLL